MLEVDLPSASRFLEALGSADNRHTFQVFPEGETEAYPHGWSPYGTFEDLAPALENANGRGCGVSVLVNLTAAGGGTQHKDIVQPRAVFIDLDEPGPDGEPAPIPSFGKDRWPSAVVRTRRGYHCYWWLDPQQQYDWELWEKVQRQMARRWHGDEHMVDRRKCLRIPGLVHTKAEPPMLVELAHLDDRRWTLEQIVDAFKLRTDEPAAPPSTPPRDRPAWALAAISSMPQADRAAQYEEWVLQQPGAVSGSGGHDQLVKVIKMAWNFGVDWNYAWDVVDRFNGRCSPPWDNRQLRTQFDSATRSRFDSSSWESQLWAPDPPVIVKESPRPEEVPSPESGRSGRAVVRKSSGPIPAPPIGLAELPEEPPLPDESSAPQQRRRPPSRQHNAGDEPPLPDDPPGYTDAPGSSGGGDGTGTGADDDDGGGSGHEVLDKNAPLESARLFIRKKHVRGLTRTLGLFRRNWYAWSGERYQGYSRERINKNLYAFASDALTWGPPGKNGHRRLVPFNPNASKVHDMRHALEALTFVDDNLQPPCWIGKSLDPQPPPQEIVSCANGLLHLPTMAFLGARPDYFNLTALGVAYDPNAPEPTAWLRFLDDLWPDDRDSQRLLQEWFGLCLVPDTSYQKALMIVGPKRSGKGTIARVLNALHGAQNSVAWPSLTDLVSRFGMQGLLDKTVAVMPDLRVSGRLDTQQAIERFLQITGEDWVQVDRKNLPMIQAQIPVRFLLLSNLPPRLPDAGGAFASRVMALQLESTFFGREDRFLTDRLLKELPGILRWSIEGWSRLRSRGKFVQPGTAEVLLEELSHLSNPLQAFVEERCELGDYETFTDELFVQWRKWCEAEGRSAVGEKSTFIRNMRAAYPQLRMTRPRNANNQRVRALSGVRIVYDGARPEPEQTPLPNTPA